MIKSLMKKLDKFINVYLKPINKRTAYYRKQGMDIGYNLHVFNNVSFGSEPYLIKLGDNVRITNGCKFITHDGGVWVLRNKFEDFKNADSFGKIVVGNNVFFGNDCMILPNVSIGDNVVIGARSVVTKNIPSNSVVVGIPARVIKSIDEYRDKMFTKVDFTKHMSDDEKKKYLLKNN